MTLQILDSTKIPEILPIVAEVNDKTDPAVLQQRLEEMFGYENYICFGLYDDDTLIAVCSGWTLTKLYSGRQLELDNVAVLKNRRNQGVGSRMTDLVEGWAAAQGYVSLELNSYVHNVRSHKFYFRHGYSIIGFHFQKDIGTET